MNEVQTTSPLVESNQALIQEAVTHLASQGRTIDLSHWLTIKRYVQKYQVESTNTVSNWIARGIIPAEDVIQLEELNGLKLIRDKPYKE